MKCLTRPVERPVHCAMATFATASNLLKLNYQDVDGETAVSLAVIGEKVECVRLLAETGKVDWNKGNKHGETPLYHAVSSDILDIIMKQPNIDYNVKIRGETLAQLAAQEGGVHLQIRSAGPHSSIGGTGCVHSEPGCQVLPGSRRSDGHLPAWGTVRPYSQPPGPFHLEGHNQAPSLQRGLCKGSHWARLRLCFAG